MQAGTQPEQEKFLHTVVDTLVKLRLLIKCSCRFIRLVYQGFLLHRIRITTKISITKTNGTTMATNTVVSEIMQMETVLSYT